MKYLYVMRRKTLTIYRNKNVNHSHATCLNYLSEIESKQNHLNYKWYDAPAWCILTKARMYICIVYSRLGTKTFVTLTLGIKSVFVRTYLHIFKHVTAHIASFWIWHTKIVHISHVLTVFILWNAHLKK